MTEISLYRFVHKPISNEVSILIAIEGLYFVVKYSVLTYSATALLC